MIEQLRDHLCQSSTIASTGRLAEATLEQIAGEIGFETVNFQYEPIAAALDLESLLDMKSSRWCGSRRHWCGKGYDLVFHRGIDRNQDPWKHPPRGNGSHTRVLQ